MYKIASDAGEVCIKFPFHVYSDNICKMQIKQVRHYKAAVAVDALSDNFSVEQLCAIPVEGRTRLQYRLLPCQTSL